LSAATLEIRHHPRFRLLVESRPPAMSWTPADAGGPGQPMLPGPPTGIPDVAGVARLLVTPPGTPGWDPALRDPGDWAALLAVALLQTLQGQRPVGQLERWLDPEVLGAVGFLARTRARAAHRPAAPERPGPTARAAPKAAVRSVRVQCPTSRTAEVSVHLSLGRRSLAMALRLDAYGDRWLCTALELGPRPDAPSASVG
jgi:Family of unknown function (DUF6459)